ncbi:MAG: M81 family metallopeptidase [Hyphomicrobiaceae bacterium]
MRVFMACLGTETNTFSSMPTGMATFAETMLFYGDATRHPAGSFNVPLHVWRKRAEAAQCNVIEGLSAFAQPGGLTARSVYEKLRDEMLANLADAGEVDIVLLSLHGAMVADGYDDCEGDMLERVRQLVGPNVTVGAELDLHCSLTSVMVENADVLVIYKEYPHIDIAARADELFDLCIRTSRREIKPVMAVHDCRMIDMWRTTSEPMASFVQDMTAAEGRDGVLSVSFAHGFPWGDVPDASAKMLVVGDGDKTVAATVASQFADRIWALRGQTSPVFLSVDEAMDAIETNTAGLLVLADVADNAGGGAPSDSTFLLQALLNRGLDNVVSGYYWDPIAVRFCEEAGEGARLILRIGGKCGSSSGNPVDIQVQVRRILPNAVQTFGDGRQPMGTAVWLTGDGDLNLVLSSTRTQVFHPDGFAQLGIELKRYRAVIVKSIQHFYAGFAPIVDRIAYVAADGAIPPDFASIPYRKFTAPYWPKTDDPF